MSIWADIHRRSNGIKKRKEDSKVFNVVIGRTESGEVVAERDLMVNLIPEIYHK